MGSPVAGAPLVRRLTRRSCTLVCIEDYEQHAARVAAATRASQRGNPASSPSSAAKRLAIEVRWCAALEDALLAWERLCRMGNQAGLWLTAREAWMLCQRLCCAVELARLGRALTTLGYVGGLASAGALNAALRALARGPAAGRLVRVGPVRRKARWEVLTPPPPTGPTRADGRRP